MAGEADMLLVFVDETGDQKFKDYLGLSIATINSQHYPSLKVKAQQILHEAGWDPTVEFKGAHLFAASRGCPAVSLDKRIDAAGKLLDLNVAKKNSRMHFTYGSMTSAKPAEDYLANLPALLYRAVHRAPSGAGKNLAAVICDQRPDVPADRLHRAIAPVIDARGYVLLEQVTSAKSSFDTVGLMFADVVGYLAGRVDTISADAELFDGITEADYAQHGKLRKLQSSRDLIAKIKRLVPYTNTISPPLAPVSAA